MCFIVGVFGASLKARTSDPKHFLVMTSSDSKATVTTSMGVVHSEIALVTTYASWVSTSHTRVITLNEKNERGNWGGDFTPFSVELWASTYNWFFGPNFYLTLVIQK